MEERTPINPSIVDTIEWDPAVIAGMDTQQLLIQLLAFHHLRQPKRRYRLDAIELQKNSVAALKKVIAKLKADPLTQSFVSPVEAILNEYESADPTEGI